MTQTESTRPDAVPDIGAIHPVPSLTPDRRRAADPVAHLTRAQRESRGDAARVLLPRSGLAALGALDTRPGPDSDLLVSQGTTRVPTGPAPVRPHGDVRVPAFYRGGRLLIMASDLAATPDSGLDVQLCGDAHSNFGSLRALRSAGSCST